MGTRESIDQKAERYLAEDRVSLVDEERDPDGLLLSAIVAVQGSAPEPYRVKYLLGTWTCPCEARVWRCTHLVAASKFLQVEVVPPPEAEGEYELTDEELAALLRD